MVILVDTSAILALIDTQDEFHHRAKDQWKSLIEQNDALLSNNYAILESISLVQRRFGMDSLHTLQSEILDFIEIDWIDKSRHEGALTAFLGANRRQLSLVECSCFETMRRLGIEKVFTFDEHFREQGFEVIP